MSWVGHKGTWKAYKILVRRSEWKRLLGSLRFYNTQRHNNTDTWRYILVWSDHILWNLYAQATFLYSNVQEEWGLHSGQITWICREQNFLSFLKHGLVFLPLYIIFIPFTVYSNVHSYIEYATSCPWIWIILVFPVLDSAIAHYGSPMRAVFLSG